MNSDTGQSHKLLRDELHGLEVPAAPEVKIKHYALLDDGGRQQRRPSRVPITVVLVLAGFLAGWIGGKFLPGVFQRSKPPTDVSAEEIAVPPQPPQLQQGSRPLATGVGSGGKSLRPRDQQPDSQPVNADSQPSADARADEDKQQEDRKVGVPAGDQPTKEIGLSALDKILKENEKIKRGKHLRANRNEE